VSAPLASVPARRDAARRGRAAVRTAAPRCRALLLAATALLTAGALQAAGPAQAAGAEAPAAGATQAVADVTAPRAARPPPAQVLPGLRVGFPRDHGSHPDHRTEWWYVTGWLSTTDGETLGFQVTFFRTRPDAVDEANPSAFTPRQIVIGHAAISDPLHKRLWKAQRVARAGFGLAEAREGDTEARLDGWTLVRQGNRYETRVVADEFGFELTLDRSQPPMLNGIAGYSQKGPRPESASGYYSVPQLRVTGSVLRGGQREDVTGEAWLDHEWSSAYLDERAAGWDWIGLNLDDGGALMAFRIRDRDGRTHWAGGTLRRPDGTQQAFRPDEIEFIPGRRWRSPRTGVEYPVEFEVRAGALRFALEPLMDDQESDTRGSTGAIYWEGAVEAITEDRGNVGRGYLELTGYGEKLQLP
jgi:predicted secreted hydrolase